MLKQTIWGGGKIAEFKHINGNTDSNIGESWEISDVKGSESVAENGPHKGKTLHEIAAEMKEELVGADNYKRFGNDFPLLVKFIDARQDLSIQVHPNDEQAKRKGLKNGKTEMWYIMESEPDAKLLCGLKHEISPEKYKQMVADGTICDAIASFPVKEGDCFFIPSGRIHSICQGCFLADLGHDLPHLRLQPPRQGRQPARTAHARGRGMHRLHGAKRLPHTICSRKKPGCTTCKLQAFQHRRI
jgi:mannose-6-phosphate isomerase